MALNAVQTRELEVVYEALVSVATTQLPELTPDCEIADLGYSSVQTMEFLTCIEESIGTRIPPEALMTVQTISDLAEIVRAAMTGVHADLV